MYVYAYVFVCVCVCVCACMLITCVHISEMYSQKEDPHTNSSNQVICSARLRVSAFVCLPVTLTTRMTIMKRTAAVKLCAPAITRDNHTRHHDMDAYTVHVATCG